MESTVSPLAASAPHPTRAHAFGAAVACAPHPALRPEPVLTRANRLLELRVYWGSVLLGVNHYRGPRRITIGEVKGADVFISSEGLPVEKFPLIELGAERCLLALGGGDCALDGELERDGKLTTLAQLRAGRRGPSETSETSETSGLAVELGLQDRALVHWGGASLAVRFVPPAEAPERGLLAGADLGYFNLFFSVAAAHLVVLATLLWHPVDTAVLDIDRFETDVMPYVAALTLPTPPTPLPTPPPRLPDPRPTASDLEVASAPRSPAPPSGGLGRARPGRASLNDFWRQGGLTGGSLLAQSGGKESMAELAAAVLDMKAPRPGRFGGLDVRGGRPDGAPWGQGSSRDGGPIPTSGGGRREPHGWGRPGGGRLDAPLALAMPRMGEPLPRDAIQRVVDKNKEQVRYCYERQLQRHHGLEGRVVLRWVIGANGQVARVWVEDSTLDDDSVEQCIVEKVRGWQFPRPAGGGTVEVGYPFVLRES